MCNSTEFKFCSCLKRDFDRSKPHWLLYSAKEKGPPSILIGVISRRLQHKDFDFDDFEKTVDAALASNGLFDFDFKPNHLDLVHAVIPHLNYHVTFQYNAFVSGESKWLNFNYGFDSLYDFKINRLTQGKIHFRS